MSLLKQDTISKEQVKKIRELDSSDNSKEYKMVAIWDSTLYANKLDSGYLPNFYYLIIWKSYLEEKNT